MTTKFKIVGGPGKFELMTALFERRPELPYRHEFKLMAVNGPKRPLPSLTSGHGKDSSRGIFLYEVQIVGVEAYDDSGQNWILKIRVPHVGNAVVLWNFYPKLFPPEKNGLLEIESVRYSTHNRQGELNVPSLGNLAGDVIRAARKCLTPGNKG